MDAEESEKVMGAPSKFDVCEYGRAESLFHCSEPHEVLGVSHDHRCDEIRAKFRALADEVERLRAERIELCELLLDARTQIAHAAARGQPTQGNVKWLTAIDAKLRGAP